MASLSSPIEDLFGYLLLGTVRLNALFSRSADQVPRLKYVAFSKESRQFMPMEPKPDKARAPPIPYVDAAGNRFYNVWQAAQLVGGVSQKTMWNWAAKGVTSFGFKLDVQEEPVLIHRICSKKNEPRTHKQWRMLIPEAEVFALREIFQEVGRDKPGPFTDCERNALRVATRRKLQQLATFHQ